MLTVLDSGTIIVPVGSRVTCSPPPMDTDEDFLLLVDDIQISVKNLKEMGFSSGMTPEQEAEYEGLQRVSGSRFKSLRFGVTNYIITDSHFFFERFLTATHICKTLNLMEKSQRIMVFNGVFGEGYFKEIDGVTSAIGKQIKDGIQKEVTKNGQILSGKKAFMQHVDDLAANFETDLPF
jgi:hypothetical protein